MTECTKQPKTIDLDLRYRRQNPTGAPIEPARAECGYTLTVEQVLAVRSAVPQTRVRALSLSAINYATLAEQLHAYLIARGFAHVMNETDEENVAGIYDGLSTTSRDRDNALAEFIICTALMDCQVWS